MTTTPRKAHRTRGVEPSAASVFGKNLRSARLESGRTQADIAHQAGLSQTKLLMIEAGKTDVRISTARKLARAVGRSRRDLLPD